MATTGTWDSTLSSRLQDRKRQGIRSLEKVAGKRYLTVALLSFLAGITIGLPILGWWLWPLSVQNATPSDLAPVYQEAYVAMAADSYSLNGNLALLQARLDSWNPKEVSTIVQSLADKAAASGTQIESRRLQQLATDLGLDTSASTDSGVSHAASSSDAVTAQRSTGRAFIIIGLVAAGVFLLVGGYLLFRQPTAVAAVVGNCVSSLQSLKIPRPHLPSLNKITTAPTQSPSRIASKPETSAPQAAERSQDEQEISLDEALNLLAQEIELEEGEREALSILEPRRTETSIGSQEVSDDSTLGRFLVTYRFGVEQMFDTSFSIESENDDFLGECGAGVAETIGDDSPEKPCAMEIWLFDKSNVRTTTQVIVSDYAFENDEIRDSLSGRGEIIRAEKGRELLLETSELILHTEITDIRYGESADAPPRSYFQELALEMTARRRN